MSALRRLENPTIEACLSKQQSVEALRGEEILEADDVCHIEVLPHIKVLQNFGLASDNSWDHLIWNQFVVCSCR